MVQIIPAILANSEEQYAQDLVKLEQSKALKEGWVHIDFADSKFVPNKTVGLQETAKYPTSFKKEAHLMVLNPKEWIKGLIRSGFGRVLFHVESEDDIGKCIDEAKIGSLKAGLVLKHETPIEKLEPFISKIDVVLLMSVVPGFQGQPFIENSLDKVRQLKSKQWGVRVGIDGAVRDTNIKQIVNAGVDFVSVGSFLVRADPDENLEKLWGAING